MQIKIDIDPTVASSGIQTIGVALGLQGGVTDEQCRLALAADLKKRTYDLFLRGDKINRDAADVAAAVAAASQYITAS